MENSYMMDIAIANSYIMYKQVSEEKLSFLEFRKLLRNHLNEVPGDTLANPKPTTTDNLSEADDNKDPTAVEKDEIQDIAELQEDPASPVESMDEGASASKPVIKHFLMQNLKRDKHNRKIRKRCPLCYEELRENYGSLAARKNSKTVSTYCKGCENKPFLCFNHFELYHKKEKKKAQKIKKEKKDKELDIDEWVLMKPMD